MVVDHNHDVIDVIIRFHDVKRLYELERAVFSVFGQEYRPINVILALQRLSDAEVAQTTAMMDMLLEDDEDVTFEIVRWDRSEPKDARSILMSQGMRRCRGRYITFLDYDDTLYPEAYRLLTDALKAKDAAIAFGSLRILQVDVFDKLLHAQKTLPYFAGSTLRDLLRQNFCPIHSFAIDRAKVPDEYIYFDSAVVIEEDYEFLLRICSSFKSDFSLIGKQIGDYIYKSDGSNTIPAPDAVTEEFASAYRNTFDLMSARRRVIRLSPAVMEVEGIASSRPITIDQYVRDDYDSAPEV